MKRQPAGLTDLEKDIGVSYRWWTPDELAETYELIVPATPADSPNTVH